MKFKPISALLIFSLVLLGSLPVGFGEMVISTANAASQGEMPQPEDIGPKLRDQATDEHFQKQLKKRLKKQAENINKKQENRFGIASHSRDTGTYAVGDEKYFLGYDTKGDDIKKYTLKKIGDNVEVWLANDHSWPEGDNRPVPKVTQKQIDNLVEEFDNNIYDKEREFFGEPDEHNGENAIFAQVLRDAGLDVPDNYYKPNDGKSRVVLLIDNFRDENYYDPTYPNYVAGFFSPTYETYFDRNIVNIDSYGLAERTESTYGTLAHEFQHLIHADDDANEVTWMNEGMSDLTEYLVGYGHPQGHVNFFLNHPENSLVSWDEYLDVPTGPETLGDYGQAYLLELYIMDHYGKDFIQKLARDPSNGIKSVNHILEKENAGIDFAELFRDFSVALAIDSPNPGNGKYNFKSIDLRLDYNRAKKFDKEGVPAWGTDYVKLPDKAKNVDFELADFKPIPWKAVNDPLNSGHKKVLYGGKGNLADHQMVIKANLTDTNSPTLTFDHYYDIEETWDYGMVQISNDGGQTWTSLGNEHTRSKVSSDGLGKIQDNLPGFTGSNDEWTHESFDLSSYAGEKVLISFRYLTDWASNNKGWYIDNIAIPEVGFSSDGGSLNKFHSIDEVLNQHVNYKVTFVNQKQVANGKRTQYKVLNYDPFNITDETLKNLKQIRSKGDNYMIFTQTARAGQRNPAAYSYDVRNNVSHGPQGHIKGRHHGKGHH